MPRFRLTLEYDGSAFEGWQAQGAGRRTVQETLEQALAAVGGRRVRVVGAGRTDAGVHAEGQVASVAVETRLPPEVLQRALNARLPADVAVVRLERAPRGFDARRSARSKLYRYRIWNGPVRSPLRERGAHWVRTPLDLRAMRAAARSLVGRHDFASLQSAGSGPVATIRTLTRVEVLGKGGAEVVIEVEGSGFLRHMVRTLAGTLIEVGRGRRPAGSLPALLAARDRRRAGATAPARGLSLVRVDY